MRKAILPAALAMIIVISGTAQKTVPGNTGNKSITDTINVSKAKGVTIDSMTISTDDLRYILSELKKQKVPLLVDGQWIASLWGYIQTSRNGDFTPLQVDQLKVPLAPYIQRMQQDQQRQAGKQ